MLVLQIHLQKAGSFQNFSERGNSKVELWRKRQLEEKHFMSRSERIQFFERSNEQRKEFQISGPYNITPMLLVLLTTIN